jgi:hypothetical protein
LHVLDVKCMLDVERYRRVNVDATAPEQLYADADLLRPENNAGFLRQCVDRFREVNFADQATGRVYLSLLTGAPIWCDRDALALASAETRAGIHAAAPAALERDVPSTGRPRHLSERIGGERFNTVGAWGSSS